MKYALLINASPFGTGHVAALAFARAVHRRGHKLTRVFFYRDGVLTANKLQQPPQGEHQPAAEWQALADATGCELIVCIAAALRRGVVDAREAERYELSANNLADGFLLSGLGQLIEAGADNDRLITFG